MTEPRDQSGHDAATLVPLGECMLLLQTAAEFRQQQRLWQLRDRLQEEGWYPVLGMYSLGLPFDPLRISAAAAGEILLAGWAEACPDPRDGARLHRVPVRYGGQEGPDLSLVAEWCNLPAAAVIEWHAAVEYRVYCLGFLPGFAYLGGLDSRLAVPRRASPRLRVEAGSVGIGGTQTGIYPQAAPGGWHVIGRTDCRLFDPERQPVALMQPGDRVRFEPV